jgi:methyltransferase-like protein/2-polyprenyl-3-methyl-5-hydroxy-6-metoxy-1,4-benzoquinol methylase
MTELVSAPGGDYNLVPYVSKPFPQSQPPRLAALAAMFGLASPDVSQCKMLELGCASGGNIIPLALRFPDGQFRGVDLTERHVFEGQARVRELGLGNIQIDQGDIAALDLGGERFDYIVCHGVYSWVPPPVRDAILRISADNLTENGIAYVSYNVYPGWQLRSVIRDMMIYHAGTEGDPRMRIAKARWVLENIAKSSPGGTPYGEMLRSEAKLLAGTDDSYIFGEFLVRENAPCYFRDFVARAEAHGLVYLCETELQQCIPEHISPDVGAMIRVMSRNNLIPQEQYMDFFKGRTFRQTLLVKASRTAEIERQLVPQRVKGLHVSGRNTLADKGDGTSVFSSPTGGTLATTHPGVRQALQRLSEVFPATRTVAELETEVRGADHRSIADLEDAILDAVFKMIVLGHVNLSTVPLRLGKAAGARPQAWPLSRHDALHGSSWTTNPAHNSVALDVVCTALLPFLDGSHDRDALRQKLLDITREGRIRLLDKSTGRDLKDDALEAAADEQVAVALNKLAAEGLLEE